MGDSKSEHVTAGAGAEIGGTDEGTSGGDNGGVGENIVIKWRREQMNKLLNKQVGDDCVFVYVSAHAWRQMNEWEMEKTKWASNGG